MLNEMIYHESVLVRTLSRVFIVFAPLYLLASSGHDWTMPVAWIILLGLLFANMGKTFERQY